MESLTLTTPQSVTAYQISSLLLDWTGARIIVQVNDGFGKTYTFNYGGANATNLMIALNKSNLSIQSLHNRVLARLVTDGFLPAGAVTGTPD